MNLTETLLRQLGDQALSGDERARLRCQVAEDFERRGQYEGARDALGDLWRGVGQRPALEGLSEMTAAEVLLRAGTLSGWFGSVRQLEGAQETAKDLISESINLFQSLGEMVRAAAAQSELGLCYRRAGAHDEARLIYREALKGLSDGGEDDLRAEVLKRLAVVESASGRYREALGILTEAARLFERVNNDALRGKFHNDLACVLVHLGKAERRQDYADRAIIEYTAAAYHFERAGHVGYRASAESNLGFLHYVAGRYHEATEHLNRARSLFLSVKDKCGIGQVDDVRARVFLAQRRTREAERTIREAVQTFEKGGAQALLAEALTTYGRVLARLGNFPESRDALRRAAKVAEAAGTVEDAGLALLTLTEEHGDRLDEYDLLAAYQRANDLLSRTQDAETISRLRECAGRIVSARLDAIRPKRERSGIDFWANFNLPDQVHQYEARYVRRALIDAEGSVTLAARLLGLPHHATLTSMLQGRLQELASLRRPPEKRRRSVLRFRAPHKAERFSAPKSARPITILYAEDNQIVASAVKDTLEFEEWKVDLCTDGASAMNRLAGGAHYDLLLFDNELHGASGLELVRYARSLAHHRRTPILMFSATDCEADARRAGADGFLSKPEDTDLITITISHLLNVETKEG